MGTPFFLKRLSIFLLFCTFASSLLAQHKAPQDFGFRYFQLQYRQDPVNVLILSQKGEEKKQKPLFLFIQDSLPIPLIIYDEQGSYGTFPFKAELLLEDYHLAIIGKPFVPVVMQAWQLAPNFTFTDSAGHYSPEYTQRNLLEYYVARNLEVIGFLKAQPWVSDQQLVVAGHAEGSTIAAGMALQSADITHLIYSGGNPLGRMMPMINQEKKQGSIEEGLVLRYGSEKLAQLPSDSLSSSQDADSTQNTHQISPAPLQFLENLSVPILVVYGAEDACVRSNDSLRTLMMRQKKTNFSFKSYAGLEHNYFGLTPAGDIDYNNYNWDKVARDWLHWLLNQDQPSLSQQR